MDYDSYLDKVQDIATYYDMEPSYVMEKIINSYHKLNRKYPCADIVNYIHNRIRKTIHDLPPEVTKNILGYLDESDITKLHLTYPEQDKYKDKYITGLRFITIGVSQGIAANQIYMNIQKSYPDKLVIWSERDELYIFDTVQEARNFFSDDNYVFGPHNKNSLRIETIDIDGYVLFGPYNGLYYWCSILIYNLLQDEIITIDTNIDEFNARFD